MSKKIKVVCEVVLTLFVSYFILFIVSYVKQSPIDLGFFCVKGGGYGKENCVGSLKSKNYVSTINYDDTAKLNLSVVISRQSGNMINVNGNVTDGKYYDIGRYSEYKELDKEIVLIRDSIINTGEINDYSKLNLKEITEAQYNNLTNGLHLPANEFEVRLGEK